MLAIVNKWFLFLFLFEWHDIELLEKDKGIKKYTNTPVIFRRG